MGNLCSCDVLLVVGTQQNVIECIIILWFFSIHIPDILLWANYSIVEIVDSFPVRAVGIDFYVNLR